MTTRDDAISQIRRALRARSGKAWSVKAGRGTSAGWIYVTAPPARADRYGSMTEADRAELSGLLGKDVHHQGERIPASDAYRREYIDRANGRTPGAVGVPYWD